MKPAAHPCHIVRARPTPSHAPLSGAYPDGVLPSEGALTLMFTHGTRRATIREALALLRAEGVVERVQGIGTFAIGERDVARIGELHGETPTTRCSRTAAADLNCWTAR